MSATKRNCPIEKMVRLEMAKFARVRPATYEMNLPLSRIHMMPYRVYQAFPVCLSIFNQLLESQDGRIGKSTYFSIEDIDHSSPAPSGKHP
jgi:hypothetical protein